jgi:hypothetical protein
VAWVDAKGANQIYARASAFRSLGYRVAVVRDDDAQPNAVDEAAFMDGGGAVFKWRAGCALEDELFYCLSDEVALQLLRRAATLLDEALVDDHIRSASNGQHTYASCVLALNANMRGIARTRFCLRHWAGVTTSGDATAIGLVAWCDAYPRSHIATRLRQLGASIASDPDRGSGPRSPAPDSS